LEENWEETGVVILLPYCKTCKTRDYVTSGINIRPPVLMKKFSMHCVMVTAAISWSEQHPAWAWIIKNAQI